MRRSTRIIGLCLLFLSSSGRRAEAAKVEIDISQAQWGSSGYLFGSNWARGAEIVDGKLPDMTTARDWNAGMYFPNRSQTYLSLDTSMEYVLTVREWVPNGDEGSYIGRNIARGILTGAATGGISNYRLDGLRASGRGAAVVSELVINDPSMAPDWLRDLRVEIEILPGDPWTGDYTTVLTVTAEPHVPEPGSIMVFLAAAGVGLAMHRRRRGRADVG